MHSSRIFGLLMNRTLMKQYSIFNIPKPLFIILVIACIVRISAALVLVDFSKDYYWEYGEIAKNILAERGYSLYYISNDNLAYLFNPDVTPFPSALISPGYVGFLLPFMMIGNNILRNMLIILGQTTIALVTIVLLYRFTQRYFSPRAAMLACIIACILPDFAGSVVSFTPTALYQCMIIVLMTLLYAEKKASNQSISFLIALLLGALTYIRSEFFLFVLLYCSLQIFLRHWKDALTVLTLTVALLLPWTMRNSFVFERFTPLSTGFGLNFYRGNNAEGIGSWGNDAIAKKILQLPRNQSFEVTFSHLFFTQSLDYILQRPLQEISSLPSKFFHLWIMSTLQERSRNLVYQITSWFVFIFFVVGFLVTFSWQKHKYLYAFFIFSTITALIFFTLPRHQTMMRIAILPIVGAGLEYIWEIIHKRYINRTIRHQT